MASLRRINPPDAMGDSGSCVQAIQYDENGRNGKVIGDKPTVGCSLLVGSMTARTMSWQDYWLTTPITEILEEKDGYVRFKTGNSEYEFRE